MRYIRNHIIEYQLLMLCMYLAMVCYTSSMRVTLPLYIVLSFLPFTRSFEKMEIIPLIVMFISVAYLCYGLIYQDKTETLVSFLSKTYQFIAFMLFLSYVDRTDICKIKKEKRIMIICIIVETAFGLYLLKNGTLVDSSGMTRLTSGRQPVSGNFTIVLLPIIIYLYFRNKERRRSIVLLSLIPALWVFLSGTRGYMLLFCLALIPMYWDYFFSMKGKNKINSLIVLFILAVLFLAFVFLICSDNGIIDQFSKLLRLDSGTGSRDSENKIALDFFNNTSWDYKLFGIGFGGKPADAQGFISAVSDNTTSVWSYSNYVDRVGVSFHNMFSNYLLLQGLVGCFEILLIFIWGLKKIKRVFVVSSNEKKCVVLYWIGFFIMNCFRWSCDCGIAEMIVFAIVLGMMNKDKEQLLTHSKKQTLD